MDAVLHLNSDWVRLELDGNQEVLRWPIISLDVANASRGEYRLTHGEDSFTFAPSPDDGLGDEIALRRRFGAQPDEEPRPSAESSSEPQATVSPGAPAAPATGGSIADRVKAAGRHSDGTGLLRRKFAQLRREAPWLPGAVVLAVAIIGLGTVAIALSSGGSPDGEGTVAAPTVSAGQQADAQPEATPPPSQPAPSPTVAGATVTTQPGPSPTATTVPPAGSVFALTPAELAERWDATVETHEPSLRSSDIQAEDDSFSFNAGDFVRFQGSTEGGEVSRIAFVGDPSGTVSDDRSVLTGLGLTVGLVEPALPPEGRRELVEALGLDVTEPALSGLDDTLAYRDHSYWLRWDTDLERLVLDIRPVENTADD